MHVLPRVRELEERFPETLTVIGVHAGKFITERVTERIAEACDRLGVVHAVVNDRQHRVWRDFAVSAWPTLVLIDPEGRIAAAAPGEVPVETLADALREIESDAEKRGTLVRGPDPTRPQLARHEGTLRFPTRAVIADGRLWVADTGHGRVLECGWDHHSGVATVLAEHTGFAEPRGIAALAGSVYVADRAEHTAWRLGARGAERMRVAGTGIIGERSIRSGVATDIDLRSPWGLSAMADGGLAIAMAGSHQLWRLDPASGRLSLLAGRGAEELYDGPPREAALAQPTGLGLLGDGSLAVSDCETSAVRTVNDEEVRTIVGTDLFKFGDRDGVGDEVLLQHCEDLAPHGDVLAVADTYNDRLKRVDPTSRASAPWPGEAGEAGSLREPGGVFSDGDALLVADTGHHRIVSVAEDGALQEIRFA